MRIFTKLYDLTLSWSKHPKAPWYLGGMSFAESSFFPIPPDVLLMPMSLAKPERAFWFAWITTIASVLGGLLGYAIGYWLLDVIYPLIEQMNYVAKYEQAMAFFDEYGIWVVFIAGFSPIPYKVFTIAAGAANMALLPFIVASFIGRGLRFFLVASLMKYGGAKYETQLRSIVDWLGYGLVVVIVAYLLLR